jgi:mannitol-1-phosphate 5-dehydrogenase
VVTDPVQIDEQQLVPAVLGLPRCFLVEEFNRILVSAVRWPDFQRGITVFGEKPELLPFEEAKLYGHNATHALLGYLAGLAGLNYVAEASADAGLIGCAREAFIEESGAALCRRHAGVDPLFSAAGYRDYVEDLLVRMVNPHLRDTVERVTRDPQRKLGWEDRLIGTMRVALAHDVVPHRYARGAAAALQLLTGPAANFPASRLRGIWAADPHPPGEEDEVLSLISNAWEEL